MGGFTIYKRRKERKARRQGSHLEQQPTGQFEVSSFRIAQLYAISGHSVRVNGMIISTL